MSDSYSLHLELHPRANRRGLHGIYVRISKGKAKVRIPTGQSIESKHWDKRILQVAKSHKNSGLINSVLRALITDYEKRILDYQIRGIFPPLDALKLSLQKKQNSLSQISQYVSSLCDQLSGRLTSGTIFNYKNNLRRIESFDKGVTFEKIDHSWLKDFEQHLRSLNYSNNTVHKSFKILNRFFNQARKDGVTSNDPFLKFERPKYRQTDRVYLTKKEVDKIEALLLLPLDESVRKTICYFLFGCYSGLRFSDWKLFNDKMIRGKMLVIRAKKNGELVVIPIHPKLSKAIKRLSEFNQVDTEPATNRLLKSVAKLADIDKNLTTHVGRHTFAVRCAELGISKETTAEVLGINTRTVEVYYKVTGSKVKNEMKKWG